MNPRGLRVLPGGLQAQPDAGPLAELYRRHAAAVYGRCRYLLQSDVEARDALQDVFVKALQSEAELRRAESQVAWMLQVATRHCLNLIRSTKARWRDELATLARGRRHEPEPPERRELLRALLGSASLEAQEVAVLYFVDELTQAEIGAVLHRSLPTVRKRLREFLDCARGALREAFPQLSLPEGDAL